MLTYAAELVPISETGIEVLCSDDRIRNCFPIICMLTLDYPEQCTATGVKRNQACPICNVPAKKRDCLHSGPHGVPGRGPPWPKRTHGESREKIRLAEAGQVEQTSDEWIHPHKNFAWDHHLLNIHESIAVDLLHQIYQGLVKRTVRQVVAELDESGIDLKDDDGRTKRPSEQFNEAFKDCNPFFDLKRFNNKGPTELVQWTGDDSKTIVRLFIAALAPLLEKTNPWLLRWCKAMIDLTLMLEYRSIDDDVLTYIEADLKIMDKLKGAFGLLTDKKWCYPKWHALSHYVEQIKRYGAPMTYSTAYGEAWHKEDLKKYVGRTNKRETLLEQLLVHNWRGFKMKCDDLISQWVAQQGAASTAGQQMIERGPKEAMAFSRASKINRWLNRLHLWGNNNHNSFRTKSNSTVRIRLTTLAKVIDIPDLTAVVRSFIAEERGREMASNRRLDLFSDADLVDEKQVVVEIHPSMDVPRMKGKDPENTARVEEDKVRCAPNWQNQKAWRRDFVLLKETSLGRRTEYNGGATDALGREDTLDDLRGLRVGRLELILTVYDKSERDANGDWMKYRGVIATMFDPKAGGRNCGARGRRRAVPGDFHGLVELVPKPRSRSLNPNRLDERIMYSVDYIIRGAHVMEGRRPNGRERGYTDVLYLNVYASWEDFNAIYWSDFQTEPEETIEKFKDACAKGWKPPKNGRAVKAAKTKSTRMKNQTNRFLAAADEPTEGEAVLGYSSDVLEDEDIEDEDEHIEEEEDEIEEEEDEIEGEEDEIEVGDDGVEE